MLTSVVEIDEIDIVETTPSNALAVPLVDVLRDLRQAQLDLIDYRVAYITALALLHEQHRDLQRLRDQHRRVVDEFRHLRRQIMKRDLQHSDSRYQEIEDDSAHSRRLT